jgi:hypothetical protein
MRIRKTPTTPIFKDAWDIASVILYKQDKEIFLTWRNNPYKTQMLLEDIERAENLIQERTAAWVANYGTEKSWTQYLDGHPSYDKIQSLLGVSA